MEEEAVKKLAVRKLRLARFVKFLLDAIFYFGGTVTVLMPVVIKWSGRYYEPFHMYYRETVILYFALGTAALALVGELRKIFRTVLAEDCFVQANVISLEKMGNWSFCIALLSIVRMMVYMTVSGLLVIIVFMIAGLFSKVLAMVFEEAVRYKQENDLTI